MKRPTTFRSHASARLALMAALAVAGCEGALPPESPAPDASTPRPLLSAAVVSDPAAPAGPTASLPSGVASATVVYVSLPPGTIPGAERATVLNPRTGATAAVATVDGGFDPVAIDASAGDTLHIDIQVAGADEPLRYAMVVPPDRPPIVVRTDPPPKKRDVPLNATMLVVFSEPIDAQSVTGGAIQLLDGTTLVPGRVQTADATNLTVSLTPDAPLRSGTEFRLLVTQAMRDLDGEALEEEVATTFNTVPAPPVTTLTVTPLSLALAVGDTLRLTATVRDETGGIVAGAVVQWSASDPARVAVTESGLVTGVGVGDATIMARVEPPWTGGDTVRAVVAVTIEAPLSLTIVSGDGQGDTVMGQLDPLVVRVVRGTVPVAGIEVRWDVMPGGVTASFDGTTGITGQDGVASARVRLPGTAGYLSVRASVPARPGIAPVWFEASIRPGNATTLVIDSAATFNSIVGLVSLTGTSLPPMAVFARDSYGNTVQAADLTWRIDSGSGVVTPLPGTSRAIATPLADGPLTVSASSPGAGSVSFQAHGVAALVLTMGSGDGHCEEGSFVPSQMAVSAGRWVGWSICWNYSTDDGWVMVNGEWHWTYEHDVTFEDGTVTWPSTAGPAANWSAHFRVFPTPGTYRFRCTLHSTGFGDGDGEAGSVIVF